MGAKVFNEANRSFNRAEVRADFSHWLNMDAWTLDEAVALSLGRDPSRISWIEDVAPYTLISPVAKEFEKRRGLLNRAREAGVLAEMMSPDDFLNWARKRNLVLPAELRNAQLAIEIPTFLSAVDGGNEPDKQQDGQINIIEAMQLLFGIQCTIYTDFEDDPDDEPVIKVSASVREPTARQFFAIASACNMDSELPSDWLHLADWYCLTVIQEFRSEIDGLTAGGLNVQPEIQPEVCDSPTDVYMKGGDWVLLARQIALKKMKELFRKADEENLVQPYVSKFVANELRGKEVRTTTGIDIDHDYLRREAFTGGHWWKLVKNKDVLSGKVETGEDCFPIRQ
jgi:hypothetical protein